MTDRKPDDLYNALRDRLADYGQEPPAALWAGIRAQLPPPVDAPQLRKRRRRVPVAWLFLVMLTLAAVGAGWHWWPVQPPNTVVRAESAASRISTPNASRTNSARTPGASPANSANSPAVALSQPPATQTSSATARGTAADAASGWVNNSASTTAIPAASTGAGAPQSSPKTTASAPIGARSSSSLKAMAAVSAASAASSGITGRMAGRGAKPANKRLAANSALDNNASRRAARGQARKPGHQPRTVASATRRSPATTNPATGRPGTARLHGNAPTAAITGSSPPLASTKKTLAPPHHQPEAALAAGATPAGQQLPLFSTAPITPQPNSQPAPTAASIAPPAASRLSARPALLPAQVVAVQRATWPELPAPQPVAVVPNPLPRPLAARWAVQVMAGPALTYRTLNTAAGLSAATSTSTSPPFVITPNNSIPTPVATLERPALGSAAQATVRRTLGGHWSLSAGLGYAEYASALALQQVRPTAIRSQPISPDSAAATGIHRRDTYRFVNVPVRVGYGWTLSGRWRVGLLAGAEAAVYVGGSSTEGSACACQSQTWGFSGSPYRRLSVGASLGAEVRYRLGEGGRWELLGQPTATYLLTPLAPGYYQRHLFGGAALLGVAFNLP
ncbi:cytoskeletal protein RodZ [Hymenobacter sp. UYAg731]